MFSRCIAVARVRLIPERTLTLCAMRCAAERKQPAKETPVTGGRDGEDVSNNLSYFSRQLQSLRAIGGATRRLKNYSPPAANEVERRVQELANAVCSDLGKPNFDFRSCEFHESVPAKSRINKEDIAFLRHFKFELVRRCVEAFGHDVVNSDLHEMRQIGDVVAYFSQPINTANALERLAQQKNLPENLSVRTECTRFDPETDTMFGGQTALPGRDTIVSSLRYSRVYKSVRARKRRPTYVHPLDQI